MPLSYQLSKSRFLDGKQCLKKLYLRKHHKALATPPSAAQEAILSQGHTVGHWAQKRFANGKDASPINWNYGKSVEQTTAWINAGEAIIYEAAFISNEVLAALDLFIQKGGKRIALEVKSSTGLKDYHLEDAAIQYWIMDNAGFTPDEFYLMHINTSYVRDGEIDPKKLFTYVDITERIKEKQQDIEEEIKQMKAVLAQKEIPEQAIGPHCNSPFECDFKAYCWKEVPENSVFDLYRIGSKAWEYAEKGIWSITELDANEKFNDRQLLQIKGVQEGKRQIDKEKIADFINQWEYPLYFLDFETINPAIPLYDGTSPYQQIVVQYSLHVQKEENAAIEHLEFLSDFNADPREELLIEMLKSLGDKGSIVTYNRTFEKRIIEGLAADFPKHKEALLKLADRMVDLWVPFKNAWYYLPEMGGSASIKAVLPALLPKDKDLSYKSLAIGDGSNAAISLQALAEGRVKEENIAQLRKDLLAYCRLDTLAMVKIWEELKKL